jgi:hypothetical protein
MYVLHLLPTSNVIIKREEIISVKVGNEIKKEHWFTWRGNCLISDMRHGFCEREEDGYTWKIFQNVPSRKQA